MESIKLSEAKAHLGRYARAVSKGKPILITDRNKAMAVLSGVRSETQGVRPKIGILEGKAHIPADFDAALEGFEEEFYGS